MNYALVTNRINFLIESATTPKKYPALQKENTSHKPTPPTPWLRTTILPAEPTYIATGKQRQLRYSGLVQVDSFIAANTTSNDPTVDSLVNMFNEYNNRYSVEDGYAIIIDYAYRGASTQGTDWYMTPVMVRWSAMKVGP